MTKFSESNIKVLKKCKECGIYPSFYKEERLYFMRCPKCLQLAFSPNGAAILQQNWNMQNGFDENNEWTWHDEKNNTCHKCKGVLPIPYRYENIFLCSHAGKKCVTEKDVAK